MLLQQAMRNSFHMILLPIQIGIVNTQASHTNVWKMLNGFRFIEYVNAIKFERKNWLPTENDRICEVIMKYFDY